MVYTIAAYTITIGVLALYCAMIQHRQRVAALLLADATGSVVRDPRAGFNLGAALLPPFWMWAHGMRLPGALALIVTIAAGTFYYLEMWMPMFLAAGLLLAAGAALCVAGNRIAANSPALDDPASFAASQLPWALAGIVLDIVVLPWVYFFTAG